jgi:hypothetical protein
MVAVLDSLGSMLTSEVLGKVGKAIDVDPSVLDKGLGVVGPLVLCSLTRTAGTSGAAWALLKMLSQEASNNLLRNQMSAFSEGAGSRPALTNSLLGPGSGCWTQGVAPDVSGTRFNPHSVPLSPAMAKRCEPGRSGLRGRGAAHLLPNPGRRSRVTTVPKSRCGCSIAASPVSSQNDVGTIRQTGEDQSGVASLYSPILVTRIRRSLCHGSGQSLSDCWLGLWPNFSCREKIQAASSSRSCWGLSVRSWRLSWVRRRMVSPRQFDGTDWFYSGGHSHPCGLSLVQQAEQAFSSVGPSPPRSIAIVSSDLPMPFWPRH